MEIKLRISESFVYFKSTYLLSYRLNSADLNTIFKCQLQFYVNEKLSWTKTTKKENSSFKWLV